MSFELTGLDGSNPLGFLAALGVLAAGEPDWRLGWRDDGTWSAYLDGPSDKESLLAVLVSDRMRWGQMSLLTDTDATDIKMPTHDFRALAQMLIAQEPADWANSASYLGVLGNELAKDQEGKNLKPTAFHFAAGNQRFLTAAREIRAWTNGEPIGTQFDHALFESWRRVEEVKSLSWDSTVTREYALRQNNPTSHSEKKQTVAGAEWLAFRGLLLLPSAPFAGGLQTACVGGRGKKMWFRWPLWSPLASIGEVSALLVQPCLAALAPTERIVKGLLTCFTSAIRRSDQGGYGSFSPSRPAEAKDDPRPR